MKRSCKTVISGFVCGIFLTAAISAYDISDLPDTSVMADGLNGFTDTLLDVVPNSATQQNVWAEAWIGNLFPSIPPAFRCRC